MMPLDRSDQINDLIRSDGAHDAQLEHGFLLYTLIETAKLNDIDPQAWLADVLTRLPDHPVRRISELLPWTWKNERQEKAAA